MISSCKKQPALSLEKECVIMAKCQVCGKKPLSGNNVSFSMRHTKRKWRPNLQKTLLLKDGKLQKMKVCSRCLRTAAKSA